jgi:hypothetical protein
MDRERIVRGVAIVAAIGAAAAIAVWTGLQGRAQAPAEDEADAVAVAREECASRLRETGRALTAYAGDYDGLYPVLSTPAATYDELLPLLSSYGIGAQQLVCPVSEATGGPPYVCHSYRSRGEVNWPKWMPDEHIVTSASEPGTWLMADALIRDEPGPHSDFQKAFNYLRADGSVLFRQGAPREVYE